MIVTRMHRFSRATMFPVLGAVLVLSGVATFSTPAAATGSTRGEALGVSGRPAEPAGVAAGPESVRLLQSRAEYDMVTLSWVDPQDINYGDTAVRMAKGTDPPTVTEGMEIYHGTDGTATATGLEPGQSYAFSIFTRDLVGEAGFGESVVVPGATMTATSSRTHLTYGDTTSVRGTVLDDVSGAPLGYGDVKILGHPPRGGDEEYFLLGEGRTDGNGRYSIPVAPPETAEFVAIYFGDPEHLAAGAGVAAVPVAFSMSTELVQKKIKLGKKFIAFLGVDPLSPGQKVVLQERVKGKWKKVTTVRLNSKGIVKVKVKPKTRGKHTYRVTKAKSAQNTAGISKSFAVKVT